VEDVFGKCLGLADVEEGIDPFDRMMYRARLYIEEPG
jgi:hypothetical protein